MTRRDTDDLTNDEEGSPAGSDVQLREFSDRSSIHGAASLTPREMERALGVRDRRLSRKQTNMYNAVTRDAKLETLQLRIGALVDKLGMEQRVREAIQLKAEELAFRIRRRKKDGLGEKDIALAAVISVVREYGWSFGRIVEMLAAIDRRVAAVDDLCIDVLPRRDDDALRVTIGGERRRGEVLDDGKGATKLLRVPAYSTDNGKVLELEGAAICTRLEKNRSGVSRLVCTRERRLEVLDAHRAVVRAGRSFRVLKLLMRVELAEGDSPPWEISREAATTSRGDQLLRRYRTEKLPITEYLAGSAGVLMQFRMRYSQLFREKLDPANVNERLKNAVWDDEGKRWYWLSEEGVRSGPLLRSPRTLAIEALGQAESEVLEALPESLRLLVRRLAAEWGLPRGGFVVLSELKAWEE